MQTPAQCIRCGHLLPLGAHYCPGCGLDLANARPHLSTGRLPSNQMLHNRYSVKRLLAQGGQSAVYLVTDTLTGSEAAIKEMSESNLGPVERETAINDFIREARMLSELSHPALAKVYDNFVDGQKQYLVMEFIRGHNLEDELITVGKPLEWPRVLGWGIVLCDVLKYLHERNPPIIYRDLKPANVMLTPEGQLKLIDFGIARQLHPTRSRDTTQLGTDGYAPIEQYSARSEKRSDLYALGASLYHLLTGRVPESAPMRMAGQALMPIRRINPQVPEVVDQVIGRALQLNADDRFRNAAEFRAALEYARYNQSGPSGNLRPTSGSPLPPPPRGVGPSHVTPPNIGPSSVPPGSRPTSAPAVNGKLSSGPPVGGTARPPSQTALPKLYVWPLRLDAGLLEPQTVTTLPIEVTNRGGGALVGGVETNLPCLSVTPAKIDANVRVLNARIDTNDLLPGAYTCHLAARTNGGDQIVQVRFVVRPPRPPSKTLQ